MFLKLNRVTGMLGARFGPRARAWGKLAPVSVLWGLDLVRRYHEKLDLPADPMLFDRSDVIEVLEAPPIAFSRPTRTGSRFTLETPAQVLWKVRRAPSGYPLSAVAC